MGQLGAYLSPNALPPSCRNSRVQCRRSFVVIWRGFGAERMRPTYFPGLAVGAMMLPILLLAACVQPQSATAHRVASVAPAPDSASGYRPIAMAGASGQQAEIGIDFDKLGKDQDLRLALMYGIDATASLTPEEGLPEAGLTYTGAGDSWDQPIVVRGQA